MSITKLFPISVEDFPAKLEASALQVSKRMFYIKYTLSEPKLDDAAGSMTFKVIMNVPRIMSVLRPFSMIGNGDRFCDLEFTFHSADGGTECCAEAVDWELETWNNRINLNNVVKPLIERVFEKL